MLFLLNINLASGQVLQSPKWKNVASVDQTINDVKGILDGIKKLLQNYDGSDSAKQAAAKAHTQINQLYDSLQNSPYLTQQEKDSLATLHQSTEYCWKALEEGKTCDDSTATNNAAPQSGPMANMFFAAAADYSCYSQKAEAERNALQQAASEVQAATDIQCVCHSSKDEWTITTWLKGFSGQSPCDLIKSILNKIKNSSGEQQMTINTSGTGDQMIIKTPCLQIGSEQINQFEIVFFAKQLTQVDATTYNAVFNKNDLKDYDSKTVKQRGLEHFSSNGVSDIMLLIDAPDDATFARQRDTLKKYLGIGGNGALKTGAYTISEAKMETIFAPLTKIQKANMEAVLPYLNAYMADWGINSDTRLAYLLSQIGPETGNFSNFDEKDDGKYTANGIQGAFTTSQLNRCTDIQGYVKDPNNPEKLFNCMYCCSDENGNEASGDGWRYRGRGLIQLTHRGSYKRFTVWYNENYKDDYQDFEANPDLLNQPKYATLSALWEFCVDKNGNDRIFNSISKNDQNSIGKIGTWINGGKPPNNSEERVDILRQSKKIFNIE